MGKPDSEFSERDYTETTVTYPKTSSHLPTPVTSNPNSNKEINQNYLQLGSQAINKKKVLSNQTITGESEDKRSLSHRNNPNC